MRASAKIAALLACALLGPAAGTGLAWAQAAISVPALQLIETRQAGQDVVLSVINDMKAGVAAKADVKAYADNAAALSRWFRQFPALFPAGTETGHDTKVLPAAFTDAAGFAKAAGDASDAAAKLSEIAKTGDAAAFAAQFQVLGQACGACHRAYKVRT